MAFPRHPVVGDRTPEIVDDVICGRAAAVEALIDHHSFASNLSEVVAVEGGVAAESRIGKIDVGDFAVAKLLRLAQIAFNPGPVAQIGFALDGDYGDIVRAFSVRCGTNAENGASVCRPREEFKYFIASTELATVDGEQIFAFLNVDTWLSERGTKLRVPVLA